MQDKFSLLKDDDTFKKCVEQRQRWRLDHIITIVNCRYCYSHLIQHLLRCNDCVFFAEDNQLEGCKETFTNISAPTNSTKVGFQHVLEHLTRSTIETNYCTWVGCLHPWCYANWFFFVTQLVCSQCHANNLTSNSLLQERIQKLRQWMIYSISCAIMSAKNRQLLSWRKQCQWKVTILRLICITI